MRSLNVLFLDPHFEFKFLVLKRTQSDSWLFGCSYWAGKLSFFIGMEICYLSTLILGTP